MTAGLFLPHFVLTQQQNNVILEGAKILFAHSRRPQSIEPSVARFLIWLEDGLFCFVFAPGDCSSLPV
jgi:hypothetical protein